MSDFVHSDSGEDKGGGESVVTVGGGQATASPSTTTSSAPGGGKRLVPLHGPQWEYQLGVLGKVVDGSISITSYEELHGFYRSLLGDGVEDELPSLEEACKTFSSWLFPEGARFIASLAMEQTTAFEATPVTYLFSEDPSPNTLVLTKRQVAVLMASAFLSLIPLQPQDLDIQPWFSFMNWMETEEWDHRAAAKLRCILQHFKTLSARGWDDPLQQSSITITRLKAPPDLTMDQIMASTSPLLDLEVLERGVIEQDHGAIQADFANAYIGGGVLQMGCVQEEIRFCISSELLVSLLFCDKMDDNEAILLVGAEQFSTYKGYGRSFEYDGPYEDPNGLDSRGRRDVRVLAIDALIHPGVFQYQPEYAGREIIKCLAGLAWSDDTEGDIHGDHRPFATSNWGCDAFGGDPQLKSLLQWVAASISGRSTRYYLFGDKRVAELSQVVHKIKAAGLTVGQLLDLLFTFDQPVGRDLFTFISQTLDMRAKTEG